MAHLGESFTSYSTFLDRADAFWMVDFIALNSSGVNGSAVLAMETEPDGTEYLNVAITVEGTTANQTHVQHIHGTFDEDGNPTNAVTPTIADDADNDGLVEVLEGFGRYGDIIAPLSSDEGDMPMADANGQFTYFRAFDLAEASAFFSPVSGTDYTAADLMPLAFREIVIHGLEVGGEKGAGTGGEVNGEQDDYVPILPAAAGEIEVIDAATARAVLGMQRDVASDTFALTRTDGPLDAGAGEDTVTGSAFADVVNGGADSDTLSGLGGDDVLDGGSENDTVNGGLGDDTLYGDSGDDTLDGGLGADMAFGGDGIDVILGNGGADHLVGGAGGDTLFGNAQDDSLMGGTGDDNLDGGDGNDMLDGQAGNDTLEGMAGDDMLDGGIGDDVLDGGYNDDTLNGSAGDDRIEGGFGDDTMTGGFGSDIFVYTARSSGSDTITDFEDGLDMVDLTATTLTADDIMVSGTDDAMVSFGNTMVLFEGVAAADITSDDFMFAA